MVNDSGELAVIDAKQDVLYTSIIISRWRNGQQLSEATSGTVHNYRLCRRAIPVIREDIVEAPHGVSPSADISRLKFSRSERFRVSRGQRT